ncbi:MAG TPA: ABC transporter substrate-binding protein [Roseiflexaceae bacterium]|nr:ABC transporter substrate-binding protein [Roseiflexaceae bacterium]
MQVSTSSWRRTTALMLLTALLIPVLAACSSAPSGGAATAVPGATSAPAATADTSTAPTADGGTAPTAATEPTTDSTSSEDTSKFLVYGNSGEPNSVDSMDTDSGQALVVTQQISEPLLDRVTDPTTVSPQLAEKWEPNADSTEWTFTLRQGVKFHDGTDFNADAVVFNFQRMADPAFEFGYRDEGKTYPAFSSIFGGFADNPETLWGGIEKVDDYTVKFIMKQPFPLLPNVLSAAYFGISSPDAVKKAGAKYGTPEGGAVGTGPFKFESWRSGENIILVRNEEYWGTKAKMPGAIVRFISDAPARLAELQAGSIDFTVNLPADAGPTIESDSNLKIVPLEPFNVAYISMNFNNKPFDNPKVRQAIAHAINKQEILDGFYGGIGEVANDFLPPSMSWARPDQGPIYEYDPEKAKQLLAEAGYPDGFSTMVLTDGTEVPLEFWYMPVSRPYFSTPKPIAEAFAAQLAEVGIQVELKTEDWGAYLDNVDAGKKNGMWMLGWTGDYSDPNNFLYVFFGPIAKIQQGYDNPQLITLLQQAGSAPNQEASAALFKQAGEIIRNEVPRVPVVHAPPVQAAKQGVEGWKPSPFGSDPWTPIFIQK